MSAMSDGPGMGQHLGEFAELYALGMLEPEERARVEAHVADCAACARELGAAESTVTALVDEFVEQVEPPSRLGERIAASARAQAPSRLPRRWAWPTSSLLAVAASLVVAIGAGSTALVEHASDVRQAARDSAVLATLAQAHFLHTSLTARDPAAPVSKVIYARNGAWMYVVVDSATCRCHVVARFASGEQDLGDPDARGTTSTLFARTPSRPTSVALVDASGHVISDARLAYAE